MSDCIAQEEGVVPAVILQATAGDVLLTRATFRDFRDTQILKVGE